MSGCWCSEVVGSARVRLWKTEKRGISQVTEHASTKSDWAFTVPHES